MTPEYVSWLVPSTPDALQVSATPFACASRNVSMETVVRCVLACIVKETPGVGDWNLICPLVAAADSSTFQFGG